MQIKGVRTELFCTDLHWPDCDLKAWNLTLQIAKDIQPDLVWLGGDFLDFKSISRFLTNPKDKLTLGEDIAAGRKALRELRATLPNAKIILRCGNHDRRIQNFLDSKAPELSFLEELRLPYLLQLAGVDCLFKPGDDRTKVGELYHIHGDELPTGRIFPARAALARAHCNLIFGHVHRFSVAYESALGGSDHVAWSIGCLQNLQVDYSYHPEWQQGLALVNYTKSGLFAVTPVQFFRDGKKLAAIVGGKAFSA